MNNHYDDCPLTYALEIIGGKWRMLILFYLLDGGLRYNQLKKKLCGITNIMLTRSLRELEEYGLVKRIQYSEIPPHVEYFITDRAEKLIPSLLAITEWGKEQRALAENK